jgi:hypothetical protein
MSLSSKSMFLIVGNLISGIMVLWSSRAFYFHAGLAGWGDASADREQYLLWWARLASLTVFAAFVVCSAFCSSRYRWSVLGGLAVTGLMWWVSGFSATKYLGWLLLVGWLVEAFSFGVHADTERLTVPLCWMLGFNAVLYASVIALILAHVSTTSASAKEKLGASS